MIALSMLYACVVSACIALAAVFAERALRESQSPARMIWLVSIFAALFSIAWTISMPPASTRQLTVQQSARNGSPISGSSHVIRAIRQALPTPPALAIDVSPTSTTTRLDSILLVLWATASALTLVRFGSGAVRLRRIESAAERLEVGGVSVLVTADTGPLTFGIVHPRILLPQWFSELAVTGQQLVIAHEREHVLGQILRC